MQRTLQKKDIQENKNFVMSEMKKPILYFLAFLLPFLFMALIYAMFEVWPFGDRTALVMDLNGQYADFFAYWHKVLTGKANIFYSFSKEMGGSVFGLVSYYLSSPFFLLAALFPNSIMPEAIALITMLKIGACGLTCAIFLSNIFKKTDISVVLFSIAYAMSTYMMHYQMCIMWLDGVIWLPIILLGTEHIIENKSGRLFLISYTMSLFSNYYTAYINTVFVILYFFSRYFILISVFDKKDFLNKIFKMLCIGLCGVLLSMVVLFPTFLDILNGKMAAGSYVPEGFLNVGITGIARRLFIGQYDTITNSGVPNIFCGMIVGIMTVVFFFNSKISARKRYITGAVFLVLFISFFVKGIDMAWHIFQYPSWYPYRYAYVFCLFAVMTAANGFYEMQNNPQKKLPRGFEIYLILLVLVCFFTQNLITNKPLAILSIILTAIYIMAFVIFVRGKKQVKNVVCVVLLLLTCSELAVNGLATIRGLNNEHEYKSRSEYKSYVYAISAGVDAVKNQDDGLYRMEKTFGRTDNDAMTFGYNGMTHYSSTYNNNIVQFNRNMGMLQESVLIRYVGSTIVTDSLLGVKYLLSEEKVADDYEEIDSVKGIQIYKNPYALPLGFATKASALATLPYEASYLKNQDLFAESILGKSYVTIIDDVTMNDYKSFSFNASKSGTYYLSLGDKYNGDIVVYKDGETIINPYAKATQKIFCLGEFSPGDSVAVELPQIYELRGVEIACIDTESFYNDCVEKKKSSALNVEKHSDTAISGRVNVKEGEILFTTIPYDKGWTAYADGKKCEVLSAQNTFLAIRVPQGEHEIELYYKVPGFVAALCISLVTLVGICIYAILKKRRQIKDTE